MKYFNLLILLTVATVYAKVLNFTEYEYEWVKDKEYTLKYTYLEEPSFSKFQIKLYNSIKSITLDEISTDEFSEKEIHTVTLEYPDVSTGRYRIVGISDEKEISNNFSVKLVLKASTKTATTTAPTSAPTTSGENANITNNNSKDKEDSNVWKTVAIIVSVLVAVLLLILLGIMIYSRYKKNKKLEEEANASIWKVPVTERSIINNRGVNAYSFPNASLTERDLSFSSDIDGFYSYNSQYRNQDYFLPNSQLAKERKEKTKSIYSYSTNVTKVSNNILDILYPSNEKKEKSLHEKSIHEKSEINIDVENSHSQKVTSPKRKKHVANVSNGQQIKTVGSKTSERAKSISGVRARSNSFKANAMINKKSRISLPETEYYKKSRVSLVENEKNILSINTTLVNENEGEITSSNINNSPSALPISSPTGSKNALSIQALKKEKNFNEAAMNPDSPEYYIKNTKINKKYVAICSYKPSLIDEMAISKNDVIVIQEVFTDGWGLGKNMNTDKEGLLPLNCLNIDA